LNDYLLPYDSPLYLSLSALQIKQNKSKKNCLFQSLEDIIFTEILSYDEEDMCYELIDLLRESAAISFVLTSP